MKQLVSMVSLMILMFDSAAGCTPFSMDSVSLGAASSASSSARARGQSTHMGLGGAGGHAGSLALGSSSNPPVTSSDELSCADFDNDCKWRNMEGLFVDELDWFQGSGLLDQGRLQVATGTHIYPDGSYAIVATDVVQLPTAKAVLVSDTVACQKGEGQLRFMYWTSPEVRLKVCWKPSVRIFPDFAGCSESIEAGDPGPAVVTVPDQGMTSFQLYIVADHFVFQAASLQGGFAIIDNIEYEADMCIASVGQNEIETFAAAPSLAPPPLFPTLAVRPIDTDLATTTTAATRPFMFFSPTITRRGGPLPNTVLASDDQGDQNQMTSFGREIATLSGLARMGGASHEDNSQSASMGGASKWAELTSQETVEAKNAVGVASKWAEPASNAVGGASKWAEPSTVIDGVRQDTNSIEQEVGGVLAACEALTCSFNASQPCAEFAATSSWVVSSRPVGNPLTGIRGDSSQLPFNREGSFGYVAGPREFTRLTTAPFYVDRDSLFVFSYHKVDRHSGFRLLAKRTGNSEEMMLFEAPLVNKDSRRWFREGRDLASGQYDYISFEVRDLASNHYIGVDEWMLVDRHRRAYCGL